MAFFTYREYEAVEGDIAMLRGIKEQWREEGMESELRLHIMDGDSDRLVPSGLRPIKSVNYVISEKDYITSLEKQWKGGGITVNAIID